MSRGQFMQGSSSATVCDALDRVSVPSHIAVDIFDGTQWRGTEFLCTCFLCKSRTMGNYCIHFQNSLLCLL